MLVRGDPDELQTAFLNVLGNAIKYSPNGAEISVALSVEHDAWVRVSVTDHGIGIPAAHLKRIFRRFYRVPSRSAMHAKGTGLGLYIVRTIARQHGGDIRATSEGLGKGTTMLLQLPLAIGGPDA